MDPFAVYVRPFSLRNTFDLFMMNEHANSHKVWLPIPIAEARSHGAIEVDK